MRAFARTSDGLVRYCIPHARRGAINIAGLLFLLSIKYDIFLKERAARNIFLKDTGCNGLFGGRQADIACRIPTHANFLRHRKRLAAAPFPKSLSSSPFGLCSETSVIQLYR